MKRKLLSATFLLTCGLSFGQLINGSFENWDTKTLPPNLDQWETTRSEAALTTSIERSTDAQSGSYSLKMQNVIENNDTLFGFAIIGDIEGEDEMQAGMAISIDADTLRGWYKCDFQPGDSGLIVAALIKDSIIGSNFFKVSGTQSTWKEFAIATNRATGLTPDSALVAFTSTNASSDGNEAGVGSWLMIDNISFSSNTGGATASIPNGDFENWNTQSYEDVANWFTFNSASFVAGHTGVTKSTDAAVGNFSVKIVTDTVVFDDSEPADTVVGIVTNGIFVESLEDFTGGIPYNLEPTTLEGQYKGSIVTGDSAFVGVSFFKNGSLLTETAYPIVGNHSSFTAFTLPLGLTSAPDTVRITLFSGNAPGSELIIDDLRFTGNNVGTEDLFETLGLKVSPNPVSESLTITYQSDFNSASTLMLHDIQGKEVYNSSIILIKGENNFQIDVQQLPAGIYTYSIATGSSIKTGRIVKR